MESWVNAWVKCAECRPEGLTTGACCPLTEAPRRVCSNCASTGWGTATHAQEHIAEVGCVDQVWAIPIRALNAAGWATRETCEGRPSLYLGRAYVLLENHAEACRLMEALLPRADGHLSLRMNAAITISPADRWELVTSPIRSSGKVHMETYLVLPTADLPALAEMVGSLGRNDHNSGARTSPAR